MSKLRRLAPALALSAFIACNAVLGNEEGTLATPIHPGSGAGGASQAGAAGEGTTSGGSSGGIPSGGQAGDGQSGGHGGDSGSSGQAGAQPTPSAGGKATAGGTANAAGGKASASGGAASRGGAAGRGGAASGSGGAKACSGCTPGATTSCTNSDSCGHRVCSANCTWGACVPKVAGGCLRIREGNSNEGSNYTCCGAGSGKWKFCLPSCQWADECEACSEGPPSYCTECH